MHGQCVLIKEQYGEEMDNYQMSLDVIRETFESLKQSGVVDSDVDFSEALIVLGNESKFDSIGFVTFISDLEDRISEALNREVFLVLDDINNFNTNNPSLSVKVLSEYIASMI